MKSFKGFLRAALLVPAVVFNVAVLGDNVILFVGDGMGFAHVKAGRVYLNGSTESPLAFENLGYSGQVITLLPNGSITDSATAGTALATGYQHPANGVISMGANNSVKTTILELARAKGYRTGIVTTDEIGGATPGAFGAHEPDRSLTADIRYDYFFDDGTYKHFATLPNVLLGGGYNDLTPVPGIGGTLVSGALSQGYVYVASASELTAAYPADARLLGLFGSSWTPMTGMAYRSSSSTQAVLSEMVRKALSILGEGNGFFLMVEGANIDKFSHSNDRNLVAEVAELNRAVQVAIDWTAQPQFSDTLILVTADHETGGLSVPDQAPGAGTIPTMTFTSTGHTGANVPVYSRWPATLDGQTIDNTEVFFLVQDYLELPVGCPPVLSGLVISSVTDVGATFSWNTVEPSDSWVELVGGGTAKQFGSAGRVTSHSVACSGLEPGLTYLANVVSRDLSGFTGSAETSIATESANLNVTVVGEPTVVRGSVSGTYLGVLTANDGAKQTITEAPDGTGSSLHVEYRLHTSMPTAEIGSVTLQGNMTWTQSDGSNDHYQVEVLSESEWQQVQLPYTIYSPEKFLNAGEMKVRFRDTNSVRREKKDALSIDFLLGVISKPSASPPVMTGILAVSAVTGSTATLSWPNAAEEDSYEVSRDNQVVASVPADVMTYVDTGLDPVSTYSYQVRACNSSGRTAPITTTATTLLAPVTVAASSVKGAVNLSWNSINPGTTTYSIFRDSAAGGDFLDMIGTVPGGTTSYSDTMAPRGVTVYYQVRPVLGDLYGPDSNTVSGKAR